ncbi:CutA1 divalent ion tolerance protein [Nitrosococcus halophilus Nc 4]|uniref:CutA1 divalent ion tolerance protein n=1 Tax=Nitrosococcus halophilus (strain Nc4) TaxID=472759 RepID=D5C1Z1_NITHN|nr:divalent-cation tolerance protein CutA [Nitrosococcus halophilus]ADE16579.1 CutA1 divalent ion tolerance protein [Nitrosococcus halophilus Nc 4]
MHNPGDTPYQLIFCTCPDQEVAKKLAALLVENRHAACANIVPGLTSVYRWQGKIETDSECLLLIKSRADHYSAVEQIIREQHPYELPEIIAVTIGSGLDGYLRWIDEELPQQS